MHFLSCDCARIIKAMTKSRMICSFWNMDVKCFSPPLGSIFHYLFHNTQYFDYLIWSRYEPIIDSLILYVI